MSMLSENVKKGLGELRTNFVADLPERQRAIVTTAEIYFSHAEDEKNAWAFRNHVHKLAGAAATFGFVDLTLLAKTLEVVVDAAIEEVRLPTDDESNTIRRLCADIADEIRGILCN